MSLCQPSDHPVPGTAPCPEPQQPHISPQLGFTPGLGQGFLELNSGRRGSQPRGVSHRRPLIYPPSIPTKYNR